MTTIKFDVRNRWTGGIQFTADIECAEDALPRIKIGLALKWGYKSGADLRGAVLRDADLSDADLSGADLRGAVLRDADLSDADLSGADLRGAVLRGAVLRDADLSDADLSDADLSGAVLRDADLSDADLSGADLRDADLRDADLRDAVLRGADLSGADLRDADLRGAVLRDADLSDADLSGADLRGAVLRDVPVVPHIDAAILRAIEKDGELDMSDWHTCETTHCRAGWAIQLAGAGGAALEFAMGSASAGALIYAVSRPGKPIPDFYTTTEKALADIKTCAAEDPIPASA